MQLKLTDTLYKTKKWEYKTYFSDYFSTHLIVTARHLPKLVTSSSLKDDGLMVF